MHNLFKGMLRSVSLFRSISAYNLFLLFLNLINFLSKDYIHNDSNFFLSLIYGPGYYLFSSIFYVHLKITCILQMFDKKFYKYHEIKLVYRLMHDFYIVTDFCGVFCLFHCYCLLFTEGRIFISPPMILDFFFSLVLSLLFYEFCTCYLVHKICLLCYLDGIFLLL